ncbi:MAG: methylmalonyl-CoA mutase [Oligoflexales bacterium]|nr:methylmalonyl-CoA mutase [Oligoflexales bacterium]
MDRHSLEQWKKIASKELKGEANFTKKSPEGIIFQALYSGQDLEKRGFQTSYPGLAPFTRGVKASMYTGRPWTIRQYAGFSSAEESNLFYRKALAEGQKGLSVAFDLATHRGYDSDHPRVEGDVGKAGVAIDSVEDMKILFAGIPLEKVSVSMTMNGAVLPVLAAFIVAAEEQGVPQHLLSGTIQNDILKEYMVRNTYIFPPKPSMRIVADIIEYCTKHMPKYNSISISGYHLQEAGADSALELAYTLSDGLEYVRASMDRGLSIDDFAPRLSFFFGIGLNFFMEIAKLRAARLLWSELISSFQPKNPNSLMLRTHCQTSGYSLTEKEPYNNVVRTTIEAMAAVLGGTQSLHTNAFDEAIALPTESSARIARHTQLILQEETDIMATVDPFGGSYFMESLTLDLAQRTRELMHEVEEHGGMTKAILAGIPKLRVEEASAKKQARLDSGEDVLVGVNKYTSQGDSGLAFSVRVIDNQGLREAQVVRLEQIRKQRDPDKVAQALAKVSSVAAQKDENLLPAVIEAIRLRASIGEVTEAMASVFGRYEAAQTSLSRIYGAHMQGDPQFEKACEGVRDFAKKEGRQPRIYIAKLGQDGHDRGAKVIATALADIGFDVDLGPMFQTPEEAVKQAIESDVHVIGISSLAAGHKTLTPQLVSALAKEQASEVMVVLGGVIPREDWDFLYQAGVRAIFPPSTSIPECALTILRLLSEDRTKSTEGEKSHAGL